MAVVGCRRREPGRSTRRAQIIDARSWFYLFLSRNWESREIARFSSILVPVTSSWSALGRPDSTCPSQFQVNVISSHDVDLFSNIEQKLHDLNVKMGMFSHPTRTKTAGVTMGILTNINTKGVERVEPASTGDIAENE